MGIVEDITSVAQQYGVQPTTALATAMRETAGTMDPRTVGDGGNSFGLFQLNKNGELGNHSPEWAFNPINNANQALSVMGQVARQHPDWTQGQIAAAAQRPNDPVGYARGIDSLISQIKSGSLRLPDPGSTGSGGATAGQPVDVPMNPLDPNSPLNPLYPFNQLLKGVPGVSAVDQLSKLAGYLSGRIAAWVSMPHFGMRVFAGIIGVAFLNWGIIFFVMGES
jgi:hypothetical protein